MSDAVTAPKVDTPAIYQDLRQRLTTGGFEPGAKLLPALLKAEYRCSANTIREVLLRLSAVGLVQYEDQRGFRARPASATRKSDLARFRILLEQQGAAASIARGGIEWEAQLTAAHHKLSHIETKIPGQGITPELLVPWCNAEWEFHDALSAACGLPVLRQTFRDVFDQFRQQHIAEAGGFGYHPENIAEHQRIVEAALDRDADACRARIHAHLARNVLTDA